MTNNPWGFYIFQVLINYNEHIVSLLTTLFDMKEHTYLTEFKSKYGDVLAENQVIRPLEDKVNPRYSILLSWYDESSSGQLLESSLTDSLKLLRIPVEFVQDIIDKVMTSYQNREDKLIYHTIHIEPNFIATVVKSSFETYKLSTVEEDIKVSYQDLII
jgi:hypothetical protein